MRDAEWAWLDGPQLQPALTAALRSELERISSAKPEVVEFYRSRDYRPFWAPDGLRPEAVWLIDRLGLDGAARNLIGADPRVRRLDPARLARLELQISSAYVERVAARPRSAPGQPFAFVDPRLAPPPRKARRALQSAARARDLQSHLERSLGSGNDIEMALEKALLDYDHAWARLPAVKVPPGADLEPGAKGARVAALRARLGLPRRGAYDAGVRGRVAAFQSAHNLPPTGRADAETIRTLNRPPAHFQRLIAANLERARALPAELGPRYVMVDAAAGELWYVERGEVRAAMKVVVGERSQPTPMMVALIDHLIFNPYWNVPDDLVRTSIARKVRERGLAYLQQEGFEVWSDQTPHPVFLDPASVDWRAVERGDLVVHVRQRPGPKNMMGRVKLMADNPLGIYLHDTPLREHFANPQRLASAGCVRLEDAMALAGLLVGERRADRAADGSGEEKRVDLRTPLPLYITYFTLFPSSSGLVVHADVYGRDTPAPRNGRARPG